ncbi:sialic acid-binding Ig-like lectin 15 isoform X2 [Perognathus longimembris pacificus]|uniref:sialic acid-binding Ig-like lectin 15 isoform X2 n=1 Tax=Perognathus longimembris pacificus TaxID=214514 RepID=UPI0020199055|nr:sialic acid-binding Ig-like lectin 15 isoform X2 [Perognathus longimembris pacificus]
MEGSIRFLACLSCVIPMGSLVRTKRDTTGNLLNTEVHSAPAQRWSMQVPAEVSAEAGEAAVLPCTFTHPHRHYEGPLTAIWRAGEPYAGPQVFRCAAARGSELCQTALSLHGRFRLLGNPRRNDLSLRVERLALADAGRYFCRIEFAGDVHDRYESRHGVRLRVMAAPRIVNVSVLPGPAHSLRALCTAEGEPQPVLAWSGPALGNSSAPSQAQGHGYQVTAELSTLTHDGRYTCTAANSLGRAEASVYLFRFRGASGAWAMALLLSALGLKAVLLLGLLVSRATRQHQEHSVTQDTPSRPQAQESSYENLSQMNPRSQTAAIYSPRPSTSICAP